QRFQAVAHTAAKIDAARLIEITHRHRNVPQAETEVYRLGKKLRIKHEIVGVALEGDGFEHRAPVHAKAAVEIAQVLAQRDIFHRGQKTIAEVLPDRHAAAQRLVARANAAAQYYITDTQLDETDGMRNDPAIVLVIRVNHHDDVGATGQGFAVAGFLVAAVAPIAWMGNDRQAHLPSDAYRLIFAAVVHQDNFIDGTSRNIGQRGCQGPLSVIGRHDGDHSLRAPRHTFPAWFGDQVHVGQVRPQRKARPFQHRHENTPPVPLVDPD